MHAVSIASELRPSGSEKIRKLEAQTTALDRLPPKALEQQVALFDRAELEATPLTKGVLVEMDRAHAEFNAMMGSKIAAISARGLEEQKRGLIRYLVQAWYYTQFSPEFERMFGERLKDHIASDTSRFDRGNKYVRLIDGEAEEELGHDLWALQDIQRLGGEDTIDLRRDVFPETRALVRSQFDRLNRLSFKGFLGYSFYLELYVAKYSGTQIEVMKSLGFREDQLSFLRYHRLADQGHAADNIELLNFLLEDETDVEEVLDNMEVIHCLYMRIIERCFESVN